MHRIQELLDDNFKVPRRLTRLNRRWFHTKADVERWSKYDQADAKLQLIITLNCEDNVVHTLTNIQGPKACWDILERKYMTDSEELFEVYNRISCEQQ